MRVFCCQSRASRVPIHVSGVCYAEPYTVLGFGMRSRYLVCITLLAVCHPSVRAQSAPLLINAAPPAKKNSSSVAGASDASPTAPSDQGSGAAQEEKSGMASGFGEKPPSGAKARVDSTSVMYGLKPVPFSKGSFSEPVSKGGFSEPVSKGGFSEPVSKGSFSVASSE